MAELVLSALLPLLFEKLASTAVKNIARYKGIDADIKKWKRWLIQIQDVLTDASRKEITSQHVKRWLNDLHHLAYDIDDVLDDLATEAMHREFTHDSQAITSKVRNLIPSCCTTFSVSASTTRVLDKLDNITDKLKELIEEKDALAGCHRLAKLPKNFLKLKNLRHFDTRNTWSLDEMPLGIGELKNLQTLSKIIIGGESKFEIAKLKHLKNICGITSIVGLEKVKNALHAREANFSEKRLSELNVRWSNVMDGSRNEMLEKDVLNELKPCNDKLTQLEIESFGGLEFPNWIADPSFFQLKHVSISGCERCTSLPPLGQLPFLKELFITRLDGVKVVGLELFGASGSFPSLEVLSFEFMSGWVKWSTKSGVVFPRLQRLSIDYCPNLVEVTLETLPSLNRLYIYKCDSGVLRKLVVVASSLTKLIMIGILRLNDVVWKGVIKYLGTLEDLTIYDCHEIRYLWESEFGSKVLMKLRILNIESCNNLVSLEKKEDGKCRSNVLPSLRMLEVSNCKNMEWCKCPDGIETLRVRLCTSVTTIFLPTGGKLKSLLISECGKLLEREWGGQKTNNNRSIMPLLEDVRIYKWSNLKSIIELNHLVHLTTLVITYCESLESFPDDDELSNLTSLKNLEIRNCPTLEAFFGVWPPNLHSLRIGKLKKSISEWGPQNFPSSLVELGLYGDDGVSSCHQVSHLLPSSLTSLYIEEFEKLESADGMGLQHLTSLQYLSFWICPNLRKLSHLQHLTSLQHLSIWSCRKMIDLPKELLPSLLSLKIEDCPDLKERCSKEGCYWHLISHIPHICIDSYSILDI
ncbi:hypothetical protein SSX86_012251 [Deinandra increscens subsp. villosa]|uniref:Rx N-terminal domain-containing protein n=1 Tax=Deinandra increscens subsp. villosa TaxID=3103831 RepID=A0AAP0D3V3_9ASTR